MALMLGRMGTSVDDTLVSCTEFLGEHYGFVVATTGNVSRTKH